MERFEAMERERARVLDRLNDASWQRRTYELLSKQSWGQCERKR